jgi:aminoglycoside phosphotransferase (APT) family kinase protein
MRLPTSSVLHVRPIKQHVFKVWGPSLPTSLAVKLCLDDSGEPSQAAADTQYQALSMVGNSLGTCGKHSVPRVLPLLTDRACVVTEWIDGRPLDSHWRDWRNGSKDFVDSAGRAGEWLRALHDCRTLPIRPISADQSMERLASLRNKADGRFRTSQEVTAAIRLLNAVARPGNGLEASSTSWIHDDFKPANLIISGTRLVGIDLYLIHEAAVVHDIAPFFLELGLMCVEPMTWRMSSARPDMERAFLSSYSGGAQFPYRPALAWSTLHLALCVWAARDTPKTRTARNWFLRRHLEHLVPRLARDLATL